MQIKIAPIIESRWRLDSTSEHYLIVTHNVKLTHWLLSSLGENCPPILWASPSLLGEKAGVSIYGLTRKIGQIRLTEDPIYLARQINKLEIQHALLILFPFKAISLLRNEFLLKLKQNLSPISNVLIFPSLWSKPEIFLLETTTWWTPLESCDFFIVLDQLSIQTTKDNTVWELNHDNPLNALEKLNIQPQHIARLALLQSPTLLFSGCMLKALHSNYLEVVGPVEEGQYYLVYPHPGSQIELLRKSILQSESEYNGTIILITRALLSNYLQSECEGLKKILETYLSQAIIISPDFVVALTSSHSVTSCSCAVIRW